MSKIGAINICTNLLYTKLVYFVQNCTKPETVPVQLSASYHSFRHINVAKAIIQNNL